MRARPIDDVTITRKSSNVQNYEENSFVVFVFTFLRLLAQRLKKTDAKCCVFVKRKRSKYSLHKIEKCFKNT